MLKVKTVKDLDEWNEFARNEIRHVLKPITVKETTKLGWKSTSQGSMLVNETCAEDCLKIYYLEEEVF